MKIKKQFLLGLMMVLIVGLIFSVVFVTAFIVTKDFFWGSCWYVIDEYPDICDRMYEKARTNNLTKEEGETCPCKDREGTPLFYSGDMFYELDKDYVGEDCIYHKECKEPENSFLLLKEYDEKDIRNVIIDAGSPSVTRSKSTPLILRIWNTNKKTDLIIENIKILNLDKKIIKESKINQNIKPVGEEISRMNEIIFSVSETPSLRFFAAPLLMRLISKIDEGHFKSDTFGLDIPDFNPDPEVGEIITILIETEFSHNGNNFTIEKNHSVLISEPLPSPLND